MERVRDAVKAQHADIQFRLAAGPQRTKRHQVITAVDKIHILVRREDVGHYVIAFIEIAVRVLGGNHIHAVPRGVQKPLFAQFHIFLSRHAGENDCVQDLPLFSGDLLGVFSRCHAAVIVVRTDICEGLRALSRQRVPVYLRIQNDHGDSRFVGLLDPGNNARGAARSNHNRGDLLLNHGLHQLKLFRRVAMVRAGLRNQTVTQFIAFLLRAVLHGHIELVVQSHGQQRDIAFALRFRLRAAAISAAAVSSASGKRAEQYDSR